MLVALSLVGSVRPSCPIEDNFDYPGNDVNLEWWGVVKKDDWQSCQSYCKSDHPDATYFSWIKQHVWFTGKNCYCKDALSGRTPDQDVTSGEVKCEGR